MFFAYTLFSAVAFLFVLRRQRVFDFLALGFLSQQVYFSPAIFQAFGYCSYTECYDPSVALFGIFLCCLFVCFSLVPVARSYRTIGIVPYVGYDAFIKVSFIIAIIGFLWLLYSSSGKVLYVTKREMMPYISYNYILWSLSSGFGFLAAVLARKKAWIYIFVFSLMLTVYIGFRSVLFVAVVSSFLLVAKQRMWSRKDMSLKYVVAGLFFAFSVLSYKGFYALLKTGNLSLAKARALDPNYYLSILSSAEPVITLSILSNVFSHALFIGPADLVRVFSVFTVGMEGLFGQENFNSIIQPLFYSNYSGGVGSNIWAYMYATLGLPGLIAFSLIYLLSLYFLSRLYFQSRGLLQILILYGASYWAFYIHRNDLIYQLTIEKRIFLVFLIAYVLSIFISGIQRNAQKNL